MALHPEPNQNMLLDLNDANMGKYAREFMATMIVKGNFTPWQLNHTWLEDENKMILI